MIMIRVAKDWARAAIIRSQRIAGLTPAVIAELGPLLHERHQAVLTSHPRRRAIGAGAKHKLVKRSIVTDTVGLLLGVLVTAASVQDS